MLTNSDLTKIGDLVDSKLDKRLSPAVKAIRKIQKDLKVIVNYFDREYLGHSKRLTTIENQLGLQSN